MNNDETFLDLSETDPLSTEELESQVQRAQEQLLTLQRQQEILERQKRELEELTRKQEQLAQGRGEMDEKFTRAITILERELFEAQRRVEMLDEIKNSFSEHQRVLESINPKAWESGDMNRELNRALSAVDDARAEYGRLVPKIEMHAPEAQEPAQEAVSDASAFVHWLKSGLAFTLPLWVLGLIFIILWWIK